MSEEWGPWIDHDGKGCPCPGQRVQGINGWGCLDSWIADRIFSDLPEVLSSWCWAMPSNLVPRWECIIRYRVRKPRALMDLIEMVENLPAPVMPKVDA
jgi:hypothetical protein